MAELLEKIIKLLPDCLVETCLTTNSFDSISFEGNKFRGADSGEKNKLEVRVTQGKRSAYAWTNNLSNWEECALRAKKLMIASTELKIEPAISGEPKISKSFINDKINNFDLEKLKTKGEVVVQKVISEGVSVADLTISKSITKEEFLNSNISGFEQKKSELNAQLACSLKNSSSWDFRATDGSDINFESLGSETALLCKNSLKAKQLKPGLLPVVFDYNAITELLKILLPSLLANNIIEHNSFFENKLGEELFNPLISISDVGLLTKGTNNLVRDYEGTKALDNSLFTKGVLNNYLNDIYSASRMNVKPTGNCAGLLKRGLISANNLVIKSGSAEREELLKNCVYVNALMGTHTANTVSGDFALNALNSFKYDSKGVTPIRDIMISGNIFELFKKVSMLEKESRCDANIKTPMIRFEGVQVVG